MKEVKESDVFTDDPRLFCAMATALSWYFKGDEQVFRSWLVTVKNMLFPFTEVQGPLTFDNLKDYARDMVVCVKESCKSREVNTCASSLYTSHVLSIADKLVLGNVTDKQYSIDVNEQASVACLALRYYSLYTYGHDVNSYRDHKYDLDDFVVCCKLCNVDPYNDKAVSWLSKLIPDMC